MQGRSSLLSIILLLALIQTNILIEAFSWKKIANFFRSKKPKEPEIEKSQAGQVEGQHRTELNIPINNGGGGRYEIKPGGQPANGGQYVWPGNPAGPGQGPAPVPPRRGGGLQPSPGVGGGYGPGPAGMRPGGGKAIRDPHLRSQKIQQCMDRKRKQKQKMDWTTNDTGGKGKQQPAKPNKGGGKGEIEDMDKFNAAVDELDKRLGPSPRDNVPYVDKHKPTTPLPYSQAREDAIKALGDTWSK